MSQERQVVNRSTRLWRLLNHFTNRLQLVIMMNKQILTKVVYTNLNRIKSAVDEFRKTLICLPSYFQTNSMLVSIIRRSKWLPYMTTTYIYCPEHISTMNKYFNFTLIYVLQMLTPAKLTRRFHYYNLKNFCVMANFGLIFYSLD